MKITRENVLQTDHWSVVCVRTCSMQYIFASFSLSSNFSFTFFTYFFLLFPVLFACLFHQSLSSFLHPLSVARARSRLRPFSFKSWNVVWNRRYSLVRARHHRVYILFLSFFLSLSLSLSLSLIHFLLFFSHTKRARIKVLDSCFAMFYYVICLSSVRTKLIPFYKIFYIFFFYTRTKSDRFNKCSNKKKKKI